jgi:hypothetical protein
MVNLSNTALNQKNSPLLRFPAELRNEIYYYALGGVEMTLRSGATSNTSFAVPLKFKLETLIGLNVADPITQRVEYGLALTQTCRQLYAETKLLPFQLNDFWGSFVAFETWVKTLTSEQYQALQLRTIRIHICWLDIDELFERWCIAATLAFQEEHITRAKLLEVPGYIGEVMDKTGDPNFETLMRPVLDVLQNFKNPIVVDYDYDDMVMELWEDAVDSFENATGMVVRLPFRYDW